MAEVQKETLLQFCIVTNKRALARKISQLSFRSHGTRRRCTPLKKRVKS